MNPEITNGHAHAHCFSAMKSMQVLFGIIKCNELSHSGNTVFSFKML